MDALDVVQEGPFVMAISVEGNSFPLSAVIADTGLTAASYHNVTCSRGLLRKLRFRRSNQDPDLSMRWLMSAIAYDYGRDEVRPRLGRHVVEYHWAASGYEAR
jgi:hypothetical protein